MYPITVKPFLPKGKHALYVNYGIEIKSADLSTDELDKLQKAINLGGLELGRYLHISPKTKEETVKLIKAVYEKSLGGLGMELQNEDGTKFNGTASQFAEHFQQLRDGRSTEIDALPKRSCERS